MNRVPSVEDLFYHFSDEEEGEDANLAPAFDRWEQLGGGAARGPLFEFTMQPIERRRRWRNVLERAQFNVQLRQLRDPVVGDNIGLVLTEALHNAIEAEVQRQQRPAPNSVNFALTAHGFTRVYQTANFTVGEILQRSARLDEMLANLAGKLNSNESLKSDRGFQVDVVFVSISVSGSGRSKKKQPWRSVSGQRKQKNNASSPSKTRMSYTAHALSSPCERIVTKMEAPRVVANGKI